MNDTTPPRAASRATTVLLVVAGLLLIVVWISAHIAWATMSMVANLMANDSGAASGGKHISLILGMLAGQVLAGAAGIPAGLACFWRGRRKLLLWSFAILFVIGALCQAWAFNSFFSSASSR